MGILGQFAILKINQSIASFHNRLNTSAEMIFALLFKPFVPQNSLYAVSVSHFGKQRCFSVEMYSQISGKYLSSGGIYLLIPLNR